MIRALEDISGQKPALVWHQETSIPDVDLIVLPGGFSYGDYLRSGAIAARSPVMKDLQKHAARGTRILGVCNGFQILTESGLLPGALMRNAGLNFICKTVQLEASNADTLFSRQYQQGEVFACPVAHHDGNYFADARTLDTLANGTNPNGSLNDIAGIMNETAYCDGYDAYPGRKSD
ncbi:UNVERIFIED_CONTAM: hypothetical protein GTU68_042214 [Idotea baltica]|nr:hypothetical protein [Idotea baltica]